MKKTIIIAKDNIEKCRAFAEMEECTPIQEFTNFDDGYTFAIENDIKIIFINSFADLGNDANEVISKFAKLISFEIEVYSFIEKFDTTSPTGKYVSHLFSALNEIGR